MLRSLDSDSAVITDAHIAEIEGRSRFCILMLDGYPKTMHFTSKVLIGGIEFSQVSVHLNFRDAADFKPYIGIDLEEIEVTEDWFTGKQIVVVDSGSEK